MERKGVSTSTVNFSQNGESETMFQEPTYIPPIDNLVEEPTEKTSGNVIFRLVDNNKKGGVHIDSEDYVINPKTGNMDSIHLLRAENEIWGSVLKVKYGANFSEFVKKNRRDSPVFRSRTLSVPDWDKPMIEYLRHQRGCVDNKFNKERGRITFYEYNPIREAEMADRKMAMEMEALEKLFALEEAKIKKIAIYLNIPLHDILGEIKPLQLLKRDLGARIKNTPEVFLNLLNDESVDINYLILKAIKDSKIDTAQTHTTGKIYWATGALIITTNNRSPKDALMEFAMSKTVASVDFLEQLKLVTK